MRGSDDPVSHDRADDRGGNAPRGRDDRGRNGGEGADDDRGSDG
jgi:hypothetical protein